MDSHRANCLPHDRRRALNGRSPPETWPPAPPHDVLAVFLMQPIFRGQEIKLVCALSDFLVIF